MRYKIVLSSFIFALLSPAPAALAQNECGDPDANGAAADSFTCPTGDQSTDGFTHDANGDLELIVPFVSDVFGSPDLDVGSNGIVTTGSGADNLVLDATRGLSTPFSNAQGVDIRGNGDAVIDYTSVDGDIDIEVDDVRGDSGATADVIRANVTGDGGIDITSNFIVLGAGETGIEAVTAGGDISMDVGGSLGVRGGSVAGIFADAGGGDISIIGAMAASSSVAISGGTHGIYAETGGDGGITIDLPTTGGSADTVAGDTAIEAIAGTGGILLNLGGEYNTSASNPAIATDSSGLTEINLVEAEVGSVSQLNVAIRSAGNQAILDVDADSGLAGLLDFSALTGGAEVRIGGTWEATGTPADGQTAFGPGDDSIHILPGGLMVTSRIRDGHSDALDPVTEIDFGDGANSLVNAGTLYVGTTTGDERNDSVESQTILTGLDTFENSGVVVMGQSSGGTDAATDDALTMLGAAFTGTGDNSRILMDANLNAVGQTNCVDRQANGDLIAADCIDLRNGEASGRTTIILTEQFPGDRGSYNPNGNVLVDVSGGSGDPEAFVLHPDSDSYSSEFGGVIDKGFFLFPLAYDAETQQYKLFGVPGGPALQMPLLAHAAQSLWRTSAVSRFDRQRHLNAALHGDADLNKGLWFRLSTESGERDVTQSVIAGIETFEFDNSYEQDSTALTLGLDFIQNASWVVGGQVGYVTSTLEYDASPNDVNFEGMSAGLYSSLFVGDFFIDALVNGNWLQLDNDVPSLDLFPEGTILSSDVQTLGAQIEAGWSGLSFGRLGIEPLANLSYVMADFDTVEVPADDPARLGANVKYDDPTSFRGGLGVRLSADNVLPGFVPTSVSLTTRVVNEFDGESKVLIENVGPIDAPVANKFEGTFTEVSGSVTLSNTAKTVAGYLNVGGMFESDYESLGAEVGFRYQW